MTPAVATEALPSGRLAENVMHFSRVLRTAGLPVGTDRVLLAYEALRAAPIDSRADFHAVLAACLVSRSEHRALFDQAFALFWKDPDLLGKLMKMLLPQIKQQLGAPPAAENRRLGEALAAGAPRAPDPVEPRAIEIDVALSWTDRERLSKADFDTMTVDEWNAAKRLLTRIEPLFAPQRTRRHRRAARGERLDLAAMLRESARYGGDFARPAFRRRRTRPQRLVVLVDISGSMSRYSRMFLHFVHAITAGPNAANHRVDSFVFGTRLTRITRQLAARDPDIALAAVVDAVDDWSGGTRIEQALHEFNLRWARRVLSGAPTVLLVTDGLEHGDIEGLGREAERLSKSCRRLLWLNPLLRYAGFEPRAGGIRALSPHVDALLPVHNLESLDELAATLGERR
ncbi:MAG: vWA domain-containing protein [Burkholderiaceae bacterium]